MDKDGIGSRPAPRGGSFVSRLGALWTGSGASLPTVLTVLILDAIYLAENIALRIMMLKRAGSLHNILDPLKAARNEILMIAVASLVFIVLGSVGPKFLRRTASGFYTAFIALSLLAIFVHFSLFAVTGTGLTSDYILHWVANTGDVNRMIGKEIRPATVAAVLLQIALIVFALKVPRLGFVKRRVAAASAAPHRRPAGWLVALIALFAAGMVVPSFGLDVNDALYAVPVFEVFGTVTRSHDEARPFDVRPEDRMGGPIRLAPSRGRGLHRPNFVVLVFESLSWKYSDVYHPGLGTTPFLQEIAGKSLVIDRFYSVVPHTTKALVPILGGFYPFLGMDADEVVPGILPKRSLPYLLRRDGYRTAFFQTAGNYEDRAQLAANLGFETFRDRDDLPAEGFADVNYFGKEERAMLGPSLKWIEEGGGAPFFLTFLTLSTHHNYGTPPGFPQKEYPTSDPILNRYLNAVRFTDGFIRDLVGEFEKRGLMKNTVFIILGDHGEAFGEHGLRGHNFTMWEEAMRIVGLLYGPDVLGRPGRIRGLRSTLDIAPTVCEIAGLEPVEGGFIGRSMLKPVPDSRRLFFSGWSKNRVLALKENNFKYIAWPTLGRFEVYRDLTDPGEMNDLAKAGRVPGIVLRARLDEMSRWASSVNAQYREWKLAVEADARARAKAGATPPAKAEDPAKSPDDGDGPPSPPPDAGRGAQGKRRGG